MPRFAATAVSASLALAVLGVPGVALAAGPDAPAADRAPAAAEARPAPQSSAAADAPSRSEATAAPAVAATTSVLPFVGPRAQDVVVKAAPAAKARPGQVATEARPAKALPAKAAPAARSAAKPAAAPAAPQADPRGNNGTFKVDGPVLDTSHGNEPHVSCAFRLNLFGYDAGQLARIAFTAVAPTPGATTRVDGLPLLSTSTAKGGQYDGSYPATGTLSAADLGLDPTATHHVKVRVEAVNADGSEMPGGAKTKVFWLEPCAAAQPAAVQATTDAPVVAPHAVAPRAVVPPAAAPAAAPAPVAGSPSSAVLAETVSARAAAPVTVLAVPELLVAHGSAQPSQLPFTGSPQTLILLMLGLVTLAGGTAVLVTVRRAA